MAQIVAAAQMVIEQKFLVQYDVPPLLAVGLEGWFVGLLCLIVQFFRYIYHIYHRLRALSAWCSLNTIN